MIKLRPIFEVTRGWHLSKISYKILYILTMSFTNFLDNNIFSCETFFLNRFKDLLLKVNFQSTNSRDRDLKYKTLKSDPLVLVARLYHFKPLS